MDSNFLQKDLKNQKMSFLKFTKFCKQRQKELKKKILFLKLIEMMIKLNNDDDIY